MTIFEIVVLALIQGLTEFLPVSSSAHLILPSALLGFPDQGLAFDVAVHVGTLIAVVWYFRVDLQQLISAWLAHCIRREKSGQATLAWMVIVGTIPAGLAGLIFDDFIELHLRSVAVIAATTILFGLLLGLADKLSPKNLGLDRLGLRGAILIGVAQALALIPGTSRSGITMTAGLALGLDRVSAARFSFLLSIPIIVLSGGYKGLGLVAMDAVPWWDIIIGVVISALTAYSCIRVFLAFVNHVGMMPFVWYRLILGAGLLALITFS